MATKVNNNNKGLTAENLKDILWTTLNEVQSGRIDAGQADSVATQAREIVRIAALQLKISSQSKREIPAAVLVFSEN
jgi:hypothetical protein